MKKLYFIIPIIIVMLYSCKGQQEMTKRSSSNISFKIKSIKERKKDFVYIIEAERNDSMFMILSDKKVCDSLKRCVKIKKGRLYDLNIRIIVPVRGPIASLMVTELGLQHSIIKLKEKSDYSLYKADNLCGLCIVSKEED